ncbi:MAG: beta-ketoacyl synthase N-terminal-like domain-containing protein [Candidatus Brocadiia bacterium]
MMEIQGSGVVFTHGRGTEDLDKILRENWIPPERQDVPGRDAPMPAFRVPKETLKDKTTLKGMRRADRLSRMATLAAADAWQTASLENTNPARVGIILATALGPHARTFQFLDNILDFGDEAVSPTIFSHSVHNAAASYIATTLNVHGPVLTVTDFDFAFQQALATARCWLDQDRCDAVLAGTAEELGEVMLHVCGRMVTMPDNGRPRPLAFAENPVIVPGEGAAFFVLTSETRGEGRVSVTTAKSENDADLTILDAEGLSGSEMAYRDLLPETGQVANYCPVFGSMMTGTALQCTIAELSLRGQMRYASPLTKGKDQRAVCLETGPAELKTIRCAKVGRDETVQTITLRR